MDKKLSDAIDKLEAVMNQVDDTPGDEWMTSQQMATTFGKGLAKMRKIIRQGLANGLIESQKFNVARMDGVVTPLVRYRLVG